MEIVSFEFLAKGFGGVKIEAFEFIPQKNGITIKDKVKRNRKLPISKETVSEAQKLRFAFLNLTGHWIPVYDKFLEYHSKTILPMEEQVPVGSPHETLNSLWRRTFIHKVQLTTNGFKITGNIEISTDKVVTITTPEITAEDDFSFFHDTMEIIDQAAVNLVNFIQKNNYSLMESAREFMNELLGEKALAESEGKDPQEIEQNMIDALEKKGAIVIMPPDDVRLDAKPAIGTGNTTAEPIPAKNPILNNDNVAESSDIKEKEKEEKEKTAEESFEFDRSPLGMDDFPVEMNNDDIDGDLANLEYSNK